jgi:YggT family protein
MFILANLINALAVVIDYILWIYLWIVVARAVISWVNADPYNPIVRFLHSVTDPVLYRLRRAMPFLYASGIDFSPLVVFIVILFLQSFLVRSLYDLAQAMRYAG